MNPLTILQLKTSWERFQQNHPKFPRFLQAVSRADIREGSIIEINVTTKDGQTISSKLQVQADDIEFIKSLKDLQS